MLQHFDRGHREEFFQLWHEHIRSDLVDQDPSLKSLEFLLYTHFAIYHLRSDRVGDSIWPRASTGVCSARSFQDEEQTQENMQIFKTYIESIKGQAISQTSEILPLFALPYVAAPDQHPSFKDLFSVGPA